jgi:hypothetical protein
LGNHLKRIFVLEAVLVKESISLYVTESVTDVLLECPGKIRNCRRSQLAKACCEMVVIFSAWPE